MNKSFFTLLVLVFALAFALLKWQEDDPVAAITASSDPVPSESVQQERKSALDLSVKPLLAPAPEEDTASKTRQTQEESVLPKKAEQVPSAKPEQSVNAREKHSEAQKTEQNQTASKEAEASQEKPVAQNTVKPEKTATEQAEKVESANKNTQEKLAIERIRIMRRDGGALVKIETNAAFSFKYSTLTNPYRVVIDFSGAWDVKAPGVPENEMVGNVRIGKYANMTRVVLDLKKAPPKLNFIRPDKTSLDLAL